MSGREKAGRSMSASEFMAHLSKDSAFREDERHREAEREKARAQFREAERPVVSDLRAAGLNVDSPWDLVNTSTPYPAALPILMAHLERDSYPDRVREGIARALAVRPAAIYWERLRDLYLRAAGPDEREGIAVALAAASDPTRVDDLTELARGLAGGSTRVHFVKPIFELGGRRGRDALVALRDDPDLREEIKAALR
jgi:hypothetical protein